MLAVVIAFMEAFTIFNILTCKEFVEDQLRATHTQINLWNYVHGEVSLQDLNSRAQSYCNIYLYSSIYMLLSFLASGLIFPNFMTIKSEFT